MTTKQKMPAGTTRVTANVRQKYRDLLERTIEVMKTEDDRSSITIAVEKAIVLLAQKYSVE